MKSDGEIGFATLPEQVHRKSVKKGFDFTLIVVGETGLGKSTLINSLFLTDLYKDRKILSVEERVDRTVDIEKTTMDIEEKGSQTPINSCGYTRIWRCYQLWKTIERYIDDQFNQFFKDESGLNRKNIIDNRVHCCLYFISPYAHGYFSKLYLEFLVNFFIFQIKAAGCGIYEKITPKVNIVPIIAKADTLTPIEIRKLKDTILREVEEHQIKIYQLPECDSDEDEEFKQQDKELKESIPFAVIGSTQVVEINGRKVRGRLYPWGIVEVENPKHSDFLKLRTFF
ncbi:hypothetical protein CEXT_261002 [Caerostris extrusa]|uniref:Septin-type G domain-containing protein n=1 Tax=Caerostris extrusa TaxID=172846 RepID=A0AAV4M3Z4_CAEEX|nr:hypothetical protein CEXT_261002 [Caerostris extrusa]